MTARASFRLCLVVSAFPLLAAALGFYHFLIVRTGDPGHPLIVDFCLFSYERPIDAAAHVAIVGVAVLLVLLLARLIVVFSQGWQETRQIAGLVPIGAPSPEWDRPRNTQIDRRYEEMVRVVDAEEPFAVTVGYFFPWIVVSTGLIKTLDDVELEAVLRHETAHVRKRDPLRLLISDSCRTALPFVPIVGYSARNFRIKKEVEADAEAIAGMGSATPLASALVKLLGAMPVQAPFGAGLTPTDARIDALVGKPVEGTSGSTLLKASLLSAPALAFLSTALYLFASSPHLTPMHVCLR